MADESSKINKSNLDPSPKTELFVWGSDKYGQLGLGNKNAARCYCVPRLCNFNISIMKVACGSFHTAILSNQGQIYTVGSNLCGQLGLGKTVEKSNIPMLVDAVKDIIFTDISCGNQYSMAITKISTNFNTNIVYSWGDNSNGALGTGKTENEFLPQKATFNSGYQLAIQKIVCGSRHSAAIDNQGNLYTFGCNEFGQLGIEKTGIYPFPKILKIAELKSKISDIACNDCQTIILLENGSLYTIGSLNPIKNYEPKLVSGLEKDPIIAQISGRGMLGMCLSEQGNLYQWEISNKIAENQAKMISGFKNKLVGFEIGSTKFQAALDILGVIYTWGENINGELGQGDYESKKFPTPVILLKGRKIKQIACGESFAYAICEQNIISPAISTIQEDTNSIKRPTPMLTTSYVSRSGFESSRVYMTPRKPPPVISSRLASEIKPNDSNILYYESRKNSPENKISESKNSDQELEFVQKENEYLMNKIRDLEIRIKTREQGYDKKYKEKLDEALQKLQEAKQNNANLEASIIGEKKKGQQFENESYDLARKNEELVRKKILMKENNDRKIYEKRLEYSSKLSKLLSDCEEKIEFEIEEKHKLMKIKSEEITHFHENITNLENELNSLLKSKETDQQKYESDIRILNTQIEDAKKLLDERTQFGLKAREEQKTLEKELENLLSECKNTEENLVQNENNENKMKDEILNLKQEIQQIEEILQNSISKNEEIEAELNKKEGELQEYLEKVRKKDENEMNEINNLQNTYNQIDGKNKELQNMLNLKINTINELVNEIEEWKKEAEKRKQTTQELEKNLEDLKSNNRRLLELLNEGLYNKAAEYKQRAKQMLQKTNLPNTEKISPPLNTENSLKQLEQIKPNIPIKLENYPKSDSKKQPENFITPFIPQIETITKTPLKIAEQCQPQNETLGSPTNLHEEIMQSAQRLLASLGSKMSVQNPYKTPLKQDSNIRRPYITPSTSAYGFTKGYK